MLPLNKPADDIYGVRVLVVDDHEDSRFLISRLLRSNGAIVSNVDTVDEAAWEIEDFLPDIVITDLCMPRRDGFELAQIIRSSYPDIPLVAVSARVDESIQERTRQSGFSAFVGKPYPAWLLLEQISMLVPRV